VVNREAEKKRKVLIGAMSGTAIEKTLPKMNDDVTIFLKRHKENKERFKKEIQFKVK